MSTKKILSYHMNDNTNEVNISGGLDFEVIDNLSTLRYSKNPTDKNEQLNFCASYITTIDCVSHQLMIDNKANQVKLYSYMQTPNGLISYDYDGILENFSNIGNKGIPTEAISTLRQIKEPEIFGALYEGAKEASASYLEAFGKEGYIDAESAVQTNLQHIYQDYVRSLSPATTVETDETCQGN